MYLDVLSIKHNFSYQNLNFSIKAYKNSELFSEKSQNQANIQ